MSNKIELGLAMVVTSNHASYAVILAGITIHLLALIEHVESWKRASAGISREYMKLLRGTSCDCESTVI